MSTSVFIAESLHADDFFERRLDGFAANEVLKIQSWASDYRIVLNREYLSKAIARADEGDYSIFHFSCHGNEAGVELANEDVIDWLALAKMFQPYASIDRCLVMASCSGGHYDLTKALSKAGAVFGYVFGSTHEDGVGFTDSAVAWSLLYRDIIEHGLDRKTLRDAVDKINHVVPGDFVVRRWDGTIYRRYPH
jgi:hypothetical protein